jgi:DNA topoisomerase I
MPRLRHVDCTEPGMRRVRHGRGFRYIDQGGSPITDREMRERIAELAIPPAWEDVWICPDPRGHIQATGMDSAGRKQYLYHPRWREHRDREKFAQMERFANALPSMRERLASDLARRGLIRERVLACALRLLDLGFFRIGSERYAAQNETYGLATLRRRHVRFERGHAVFDYRTKGAKRQRQEIADPLVLPTLRALKRRPGREGGLFAYRQGREWFDLRSEEINEHLRDLTGDDFTAKDFRTWNATVLAAVELAANDNGSATKAARRRVAKAATRRVADYLSNTPAVCRSAYIDPRVFDRFDSGETVRASLRRIVNGKEPGAFPERERIERAVLRLIS